MTLFIYGFLCRSNIIFNHENFLLINPIAANISLLLLAQNNSVVKVCNSRPKLTPFIKYSYFIISLILHPFLSLEVDVQPLAIKTLSTSRSRSANNYALIPDPLFISRYWGVICYAPFLLTLPWLLLLLVTLHPSIILLLSCTKSRIASSLTSLPSFRLIS